MFDGTFLGWFSFSIDQTNVWSVDRELILSGEWVDYDIVTITKV